MKLLIITHTPHTKQENHYFAYGPYVREIQLWEKQVDEILVVAPLVETTPGAIDLPYQSQNITFYKVPAFSVTSIGNTLKTAIQIPGILSKLFKAMKKADHIHLRCPGNMGLLGCVVQILFPKKKKSAKYAGNWDPSAHQPLSYRFQKWILNNPLLTQNMQVMVYGKWANTSKNIQNFFTATYPESKRQNTVKAFNPPFQVLFVGGLTPGKNPLYAVQLIHHLNQKGICITLNLYGEGAERQAIQEYIDTHKLQSNIVLNGNQTGEVVEQAYKNSHFVILASRSEGWPKAIAEAMFWGCVPLATKVSCVPEMLANGERGVLLSKQLESDKEVLQALLKEPTKLQEMSQKAQNWSQQYTLEAFEEKIRGLVLKV